LLVVCSLVGVGGVGVGWVGVLVDSIGHCEKKIHMDMCLILNGYHGYRDRDV